jgi:RimJ/RimL family protein N-acetyltransferase
VAGDGRGRPDDHRSPHDEAAFRARLRRSGRLGEGWLDLAIDLDGVCIGRIPTFVPPNRPLLPGVFEIGIALWAHARGKDHGREALALLTDWLFEQAGAERVEAPTDPANLAMRSSSIASAGSWWKPSTSSIASG